MENKNEGAVAIYCHKCEERGAKTLLGKNISTSGKIELWCKRCRDSIEINLSIPFS
jgi:hypothetical protein